LFQFLRLAGRAAWLRRWDIAGGSQFASTVEQTCNVCGIRRWPPDGLQISRLDFFQLKW
jgi:hypothetical protein